MSPEEYLESVRKGLIEKNDLLSELANSDNMGILGPPFLDELITHIENRFQDRFQDLDDLKKRCQLLEEYMNMPWWKRLFIPPHKE